MTLLPTLNRTKLLRRFLKSVRDTETSTPGLIIVDENDWEKNLSAYANIAQDLPKDWLFKVTKAVKMGDKVREVWDEVKDQPWINLLNDDHVIITKHWDKRLEAKLDGTNFVTCQDNYRSPQKASGATMFSMKLLETVGFPIYPEGMKHLFIDDLWEHIGYHTGCWDIDHSVVIEHKNQLWTPQERDSTFFEVYGRDQDLTKGELWQNDNKVFVDFMKNNLAEIKNNIRKLRGQIAIKYQ